MRPCDHRAVENGGTIEEKNIYIYIEREREGNVSAVTLVGYLEERESGPHLEKKRRQGRE